MTRLKLKKLIERKQNEADKHNRLIFLDAIKGNCINAYDLIKEEYMREKHGTLTERQLEEICSKCKRVGRGAVCLNIK